MFQRCSIAKNTIRFSFSHPLPSLFFFFALLFFFFARNLRGSHSATLSRLRLPCTCNLSRFISSVSSTPCTLLSFKSPTTLLLHILFHQTPTLPQNPSSPPHTSPTIHLDFPPFPSLLRLHPASSQTLRHYLSFHFSSLSLLLSNPSPISLASLSLSLSLSSLPEVARPANVVSGRRGSQDVFLPDWPGQPASTTSPQAPPPTYPQSVSPSTHGAKSAERMTGITTKHLCWIPWAAGQMWLNMNIWIYSQQADCLSRELRIRGDNTSVIQSVWGCKGASRWSTCISDDEGQYLLPSRACFVP